eukprot:1602847-Prymnesium_polylepis.1
MRRHFLPPTAARATLPVLGEHFLGEAGQEFRFVSAGVTWPDAAIKSCLNCCNCVLPTLLRAAPAQ